MKWCIRCVRLCVLRGRGRNIIIISKHSDYYDYLANVYGRDEKKVLRREKIINSSGISFCKLNQLKRWSNETRIFVAGRKYILEQTDDGIWEHYKFHKVNTHYGGYKHCLLLSDIDESKAHNYVDYIKTDFNAETRQPLAIRYGYDRRSKGIPLLKSFGFTAFVRAEELYSEIDIFLGWLIDNPSENTDFGDIITLESKDFDKKTSFRGKARKSKNNGEKI